MLTLLPRSLTASHALLLLNVARPGSPAPLLVEHRESHLQCSCSGPENASRFLKLRSVGTSHPSARHDSVTLARKTVWISSYQDDAIKDAVETWADAVPALGWEGIHLTFCRRGTCFVKFASNDIGLYMPGISR